MSTRANDIHDGYLPNRAQTLDVRYTAQHGIYCNSRTGQSTRESREEIKKSEDNPRCHFPDKACA